MKYCSNCGHKNEPIGGAMPKFCSNCGSPLGVVAVAKAPVQTNDDGEIPESIPEDLFEVSQSSDFASFKFEDIAVGEKRESLPSRRGKNIEDVFSRVAQKSFDAEK